MQTKSHHHQHQYQSCRFCILTSAITLFLPNLTVLNSFGHNIELGPDHNKPAYGTLAHTENEIGRGYENGMRTI